MDKTVRNPSQQELLSILFYDPETGQLFWRPRKGPKSDSFNTRWAWQEAFTSRRPDGTMYGMLGKRMHTAHKLIWTMVYGTYPTARVRHANGNKSDNSLSNIVYHGSQERYQRAVDDLLRHNAAVLEQRSKDQVARTVVHESAALQIGEIERDVPYGAVVKPRQTYGFFDELELGESVKISGRKDGLTRMQSVVRTRNQRYREEFGDMSPQFDWAYVPGGMRIWRIR